MNIFKVMLFYYSIPCTVFFLKLYSNDISNLKKLSVNYCTFSGVAPGHLLKLFPRIVTTYFKY